jgi:hypothetical protein
MNSAMACGSCACARGAALLPAQGRHRGLGQQAARLLHAADQPVQVVGLGQEGRVDHRGGQRVGAGQRHPPAALGPQQAHMHRVAVAPHRAAAVVDQLAHHEVPLQVRHGLVGPAAEEAAGLGEVGGQEAAPLAPPLADGAGDVPAAAQAEAEARARLRRLEHHHHVRVVVQVAAHAGQGVTHGDAVALQLGRVAHAREHQQLRRLEGAGAQGHLLAGHQPQALTVLPQFHAAHLPALQDQSLGPGLGEDVQVGAAQVGRR